MTSSPRDEKADTVSTVDQQSGLRPWRKGESGNPAGRPRGSRNKLAQDFVAALCADFEQHGTEVIAKVRKEKPDVKDLFSYGGAGGRKTFLPGSGTLETIWQATSLFARLLQASGSQGSFQFLPQ